MNDKELILQTLKNSTEPMNSPALSKQTGIDKKIISDIIKELRSEGIICSPKRCFYSLKTN